MIRASVGGILLAGMIAAISGEVMAAPRLPCQTSPLSWGGKVKPEVVTPRSRADAVVLASWYGPGHHGRPTASGEIFNRNALTAAHPSLPFGTRLSIRNPINGAVVVVCVNDRGPFTSGRGLDLSQAAARALRLDARGVAKVVVSVVGRVQ